jgi:hypothetical protein
MNSKTQKTGARKGKAARKTQLQRIEAGFNSPGTPAYAEAWSEFKDLFNGLLADADFWQLQYVTPMLPHLVAARQDIDQMNRRAAKRKASK